MRQAALILASLFFGVASAWSGYSSPVKVAEFSGILASICSILIAMSLAVSALVSSPFKASAVFDDGDGKKERLEEQVFTVEKDVLTAQSVLFYLYLFSLLGLLVLWWELFPFDQATPNSAHRLIGGASLASFAVSFVLSIRTPSLLSELMESRRQLG